MAVFSDGQLLDPGQEIENGQRLNRTFVGQLLFGGGASLTYYYRVGSGNAVGVSSLADVPSNGVVTRTVG